MIRLKDPQDAYLSQLHTCLPELLHRENSPPAPVKINAQQSSALAKHTAHKATSLRQQHDQPTDDTARNSDDLVSQINLLVHMYTLRREDAADHVADSLGFSVYLTSSRVDERAFVSHVAKVTAGLRRVRVDSCHLQSAWQCVDKLLSHRNHDTRAIAYAFLDVCLELHYDRVPLGMRLAIFQLLATGHGEFLRRQNSLRLLVQDGRTVLPFAKDLGWVLLTLLETSDAQKELSSLLHCILRRSPHALEPEIVTSITTLLSGRADAAYARRDKDACKRFLKFMTILVNHELDAAAATPECLASLCGLVNVKEDGVSTWAIIKHLLSGASRYQVLHGLLGLLEAPVAPFVVRYGWLSG
ncbi:hypothetical protein DYB36_010795 [Aphanomyces astaci]|uniref:Tuberin N-terminal domain-containing protein n=2 Tax=Aphanomyces astaci TaxID=112090 RepID=A0A397BP52_APHAT|nr:hypothetical protein DYB36_010795 [Aphanomyces astaci]